MSVNPEYAKTQMARLGVFTKGTPQTKAGMRDLEGAIVSAAIYTAIGVIRARRKADTESNTPPWRRPIQCNTCGDTGWRVVHRGEHEGVEPCNHKGAVA